MKSILLASAAAFAFAGAAAAEVAFSGEATLGYNDSPTFDVGGVDTIYGNDGFYWDANLAVALSQALDNGLTATASFDFDFADGDLGRALESGGLVLSLTTEAGGLFFGDTAFAAETHWSPTGSMLADGFSEADGETVLRGDVNYGDISASVSYVLQDADGGDAPDDVDQLSVGVSGAVGGITFGLAYQEESEAGVDYNPEAENGDFSADEIFGVFVGTTFAGATVKLAYASNETTEEDSLGVSASYPVGPVTLSGWYVVESGDSDNAVGVRVAYADGPFALVANYEDRGNYTTGNEYRWNVEGSYDTGLGVVVYAGVLEREPWDGEAFYVAGEYDLGGGATLLVSYADADDATPGYLDDDEVGAREYQNGTTVEVSFAF